MSKNLNPLLEYISIGKSYKTLAKSTENASRRKNLANALKKSRKKIQPRDLYVRGRDGVMRNMGTVERNEDVLYDTLVDKHGALRDKWK